MAFDLITPANLGRGAIPATPTIGTLYTVPVLTRTILKSLDIANTTGSNKAVTVHLVPSGGSPSAANMLIPGTVVTPLGMLQWTGAQVLNAGDSIQAVADAAGCSIHASGGECV